MMKLEKHNLCFVLLFISCYSSYCLYLATKQQLLILQTEAGPTYILLTAGKKQLRIDESDL